MLYDLPRPSDPGPPAAAPAFEVRTEHVSCALCGTDDPRPYKKGMYAIGAHEFDLVRCRRCGLVYVPERPDGPTLGHMYSDPEYYTEGYNLGVNSVNYFERRDELVEQYEGEVAQLESELARAGADDARRDIMELGAAGGFFLEGARRRGWNVKGVELSVPAARYAKDEMGLDVFEGLLEDAPFEPGSFDVVVADNVLEHTTDPRQVLRSLHALLRPGGHALVIVPSYVNSVFFRGLMLMGRLVPRRFLGDELAGILKLDEEARGFPYHILEFDKRSLAPAMRESGFELVSVLGSVPYPAHIFRVPDPGLKTHFLRLVFRSLNGLMRIGLLPGARLRILARRPR